jgi:hypothetical protein
MAPQQQVQAYVPNAFKISGELTVTEVVSVSPPTMESPNAGFKFGNGQGKSDYTQIAGVQNTGGSLTITRVATSPSPFQPWLKANTPKSITVAYLDDQGTIKESYTATGCLIQNLTTSEANAASNEPAYETATMSCDLWAPSA